MAREGARIEPFLAPTRGIGGPRPAGNPTAAGGRSGDAAGKQGAGRRR